MILDGDRKPENSSLEAAIRRSQELTEEQRKALLGVYRSFVAANGEREPTDATTDGTADLDAECLERSLEPSGE